jgi:hypothetical protein
MSALVVLALLAALRSSADEPPATAPIVTQAGDVELSIYPFGSVVKSKLWVDKVIPVCWENPDAIEEKWRKLSELAVKQAWDDHSALSFPKWKDQCAAGELAVRIRITSELPHVLTIGRYLKGKPGGVRLNFDFTGWRDQCKKSQSEMETCARAMVVHEFGHVIGFAHEHIRADAPAECHAEQRGTRGTWNVTPEFDQQSVMNYCNPRWLGDGRLSERDIFAVQTVYGR